ncbi:MAG TPA: helix-turn-helix transcriptional regulator, partial [Chloroflexota bacterium]|nr:helix-turn-helix transcriptional regulator [Chloroflexota bacterium]
KWRARLGLSQAQLAERVGTTQSAIARLEGGGSPPNLTTLMKLADAFGAYVTIGFVDAEETIVESNLRPTIDEQLNTPVILH